MSRKKKNGKQDDRLTKIIILLTAILNLIISLVTLIGKLIE